MVTSQFIRCGKDSNVVFNVSYIASIYKQQTSVTTNNLHYFEDLSFPLAAGDTVYHITFVTAGRSIQEQNLYYETEAMCNAMFEQIMQSINPLVISQPDLT